MRPVLWGLLFAVLCLPLAFVLFLIPAAKYPGMDSLTMKLPAGVRSVVAELALHHAGYGKDSITQIDRVVRLDPDSADAWSRRCTININESSQSSGIATCKKALSLASEPWNFNGLGVAQEQAKDYCSAEDSFTTAVQRSANNAIFLRNMARAALRCGHVNASVAGFEVAEGLDAKAVADPDDDGETKDDLTMDREYLAVVYDRMNEPAKATAVCTKAHPDWTTCHCELNDSGVKCSGGPEKTHQP